jgi:DNA-binding transcriptional ArsR family regulator
MRALAHPTRLALLEALAVQGPLTATQAAELIGESPSSCSFHLRMLARHNFVEEAAGGTGRQRPWRRVATGVSWADPGDDPEASLAADTLSAIVIDRHLGRLREWLSSRRRHETKEWVDATTDLESIWWVTAAEAREMNEQILQLMFSFRDRLADPALRPPGARPIEALFYSFPFDLPAGGTDRP